MPYKNPEDRRACARRAARKRYKPTGRPRGGKAIHGMWNSPEYLAWAAMRARCTNPACKAYPSYGERGISVCKAWDRFEVFFADLGPRPQGGTLDRIDVNGNYEPGNCRWASAKVQANNRRNTRYLEYRGTKLSLAEWAEKLGVPYRLLSVRKKRNWTDEKIIETPWRENKCG